MQAQKAYLTKIYKGTEMQLEQHIKKFFFSTKEGRNYAYFFKSVNVQTVLMCLYICYNYIYIYENFINAG